MGMYELNHLLQRYPNAARSLFLSSPMDDWRGRRSRYKYPLHVACNPLASQEFIDRLVREWPESVQVPCRCAIEDFSLQGDPAEKFRKFLRKAYLTDSEFFSNGHDFARRRRDIEEYKQVIDDHNCTDMLVDVDMIYALPLDLACAADEVLSAEVIDILTNHTPPLHFICTFSRTPWIPTRLKAIQYLASVFPHDSMLFYHDTLPFHCACLFGAPRAVLEWWCEQYPNVVGTYTKDTDASPLHYYLCSSPRTSDGKNRDSYFSAVKFLVEKHPDALHHMNHKKLLPFHVAAMNNADLDVLFYLACQKPEALFDHHCHSFTPPSDNCKNLKAEAKFNRKRKVSDLE